MSCTEYRPHSECRLSRHMGMWVDVVIGDFDMLIVQAGGMTRSSLVHI